MNKVDFKNKIIMVIGAHPDDNDFISAATIAKAVKEGARIIYLIGTLGQRGSNAEHITPEELGETRRAEQTEAAKVLGVSEVLFLDYHDGELVPNIELKEKVVRYIRQYKPDYVFTMNPSHYFFKEYGFINHSDHRAIGEATIDATYPLARDRLSFPEHQREGLQPHKVKELFITTFLPEDANYFFDVTETIETKIQALAKHKSQIKDIKSLEERMKTRARELGKKGGVKFAEAFVRLRLPD